MGSHLFYHLEVATIFFIIGTILVVLSASNNAYLFGEDAKARTKHSSPMHGRIIYIIVAIFCYIGALMYILAGLR